MKALVVAGGISQAALVQELKSRGIYTILADKNPHAVAVPYADAFYPVSTLDEEGIYQLALREKVDFVLTACADQVLLVTAKVSERLGLPCYIDHHTATLVSDKRYMKEVFVRCGVPTARYVVMDTYDEHRVGGLQFPLIVKPVDSYSSRGVRKVRNYDELKVAFDDAVEISRTKSAIVEEFCKGEELTVDVYVEDGVAHVLATSINDKLDDEDRFVIYRYRNPAPISEKAKEEIREIAQKIADAFLLKNSPMLIQMIYDGERMSVLEFCARTGGGTKYRMIKKASGFDVIKAVVDLTLGQKPHVSDFTRESKYIVNSFLYCSPGVFDHAEGFEELKTEGIISEYYIFSAKGREFGTITCSGDRMGGFTVQADDLHMLQKKYEAAVSKMKAIGVDGTDLIRHDLIRPVDYAYIDMA